MNGKFIYISGSANPSCSQDKLKFAYQFVTLFTAETLRRGGGIVVLAGDEKDTGDEQGAPLIFDWVALREVERYATTTTERPRSYARIVMSDKARESKISDANLKLLRDLEQRDVVEVQQIRRQVYTGGEYRITMVDWADAMLAIGGGKGTYAAGTEMLEQGKPVLPFDLQLGSRVDDGDGAVTLHREMATEASRFFPNTHNDLANKVGLLALDRGINEVEAVAQAAAEMLAQELEAAPQTEQPTGIKRRLATAWQFVKEFSVGASLIRFAEWAKGLLPFV